MASARHPADAGEPGNNRNHGADYLKLALTMLFWGGTWVAGRVAVQELAPMAVAAWRFLFAAGGLLILVFWQYRRLPRLNRSEWWRIVALAATGIFLYNIAFLGGLQHMAAGRGALVVALNPVIVSLAAWWWLGEAMTPAKAAGGALALVGCLTVIGRGSPLAPLTGDIGIGEVLIMACAFLWAAYTLIGRRTMKTVPPLLATAYASAVGWLMLLLAALFDSPRALLPDYSWHAWAAILFLGVFGTTLGFTWFNQGVQRLGAARASVFINLVPLAAVILGAWLLDERLSPSVLFGGLLVLTGVALTQYAPAKTNSTGKPPQA